MNYEAEMDMLNGRTKEPTLLWLALWRDGRVSLVSGKSKISVHTALEEAGESMNCLIRQYDRHICLTFKPDLPNFQEKKGPGFETPAPPDLTTEHANDMKRLMEDEATADVEVHCGERIFKCHRLILSLRCEFFRAAFASGMTETSEQVIKMDHMEEDVLQVLLSFIYTGDLDFSIWDSFEEEFEDEKMMKMIQLSEAADYVLLPNLRDAIHHEISCLPEPFNHDNLKALVQIEKPFSTLQHQIFIWVHWHLRSKPDVDQDQLFNMLSEDCKSNLAKFVKYKLKNEPYYGSRMGKLDHWLDLGSTLPDYDQFISHVNSVEDLHQLHALHRLCVKWVCLREEDEHLNEVILRLAKYMVNEMGFDVTLRDCHGYVPLHTAIEACSVPLVQLILGSADTKGVMNDELDTPCDYAVRLNRRIDVDFEEVRAIQRMLQPYQRSSIPSWLNGYNEDINDLFANYKKMKFECLPNSGFNAHILFSDFFKFSFPEFQALRKKQKATFNYPEIPKKKFVSALKEDIYCRLAKKDRLQYQIQAYSWRWEATELEGERATSDSDSEYSDEYEEESESMTEDAD